MREKNVQGPKQMREVCRVRGGGEAEEFDRQRTELRAEPWFSQLRFGRRPRSAVDWKRCPARFVAHKMPHGLLKQQGSTPLKFQASECQHALQFLWGFNSACAAHSN